MKKLNKILLSITFAAGSLSVANAQWSVQDVNSNNIKKNTDDLVKAAKTQISNQEAAKSATEVLSKQMSVQLEETDKRNRSNIALADTIKRDRDAMPTLKQCIDLTRGGSGSSGSKSSRSGGGGSSGTDVNVPGTPAFKKAQEAAKSELRKLGMAIETAKAASACGTTEMEKNSKFCGEGEDVSKFNGANISPRSLMGNYKDSDSRNYKNYTLDAEAQKAALQYIQVAALNHLPPVIHKDKVKSNETYVANYLVVANGIQTAADAITNVTSHYNEITNAIGANDAFQTYWNSVSKSYEDLGMEKPGVPSLAEMYLLEVQQDYYMLNTEKDNDQTEIVQLKNLNRKMALANYLTARQINLQEYQNILMSHLVVKAFEQDARVLTKEASKINGVKVAGEE